MPGILSSTTLPWLTAVAAAVLPPLILTQIPTPSTAPPSASVAQPANQLSWVESGKLSFDAPRALGVADRWATPPLQLYIKNEGSTAVTLHPEVSLRTQKGVLIKGAAVVGGNAAGKDSAVTVSAVPGISATSARVILPEVRGIAKGFLWFAADSPHTKILLGPREVVVAGENSGWPAGVLWIAGVVALLFVGISYKTMTKPASLKDPMGSPKWDFTKSWANNITVVTSVVSTTVLLGLLVDEPVFLSKANYLAFNALLVVLLAFAPTIFGLIRKQTSTTAGKDPEYSGIVFGFLLACAITLAAVLAQLSIAFMLFEEMQWQEILPSTTISILQTVVVFTALALVYYSFTAIRAAIAALANPPAVGVPAVPKAKRVWRPIQFPSNTPITGSYGPSASTDAAASPDFTEFPETELLDETGLPVADSIKPRDWALL